jgi:soluble lytic murein transglycosylase-like protein
LTFFALTPLTRCFANDQKSEQKKIIELSNNIEKKHGKTIANAARKYNVDPRFVKALIIAESSGNNSAVSWKNAKGLMQLDPVTVKQLKVKDPHNPVENINAGTKYVGMLIDEFGNQLIPVVVAYNMGPGLAKYRMQKGKDISKNDLVKKIKNLLNII